MNLNYQQKFILRQKISDFAKSIGFDLVGFSPAKIEEKYLAAFEEWLELGREGSMEYMQKIAQRRNMNLILPDAKSVIVLAMNYYHEQKPLARGHGRVARYAYGRDYHKVIGKKLKELEKFVQDLGARTKSYVDTGPVLERALAEQAGLGRIGKNTLLITEKFGSWVFLSEIITTLDLNFEKAPAPIAPTPSRWSDHAQKSFNVCGNCTRCVTACPTGAIIAPGVVDARLCISYLTIENRKKIPPKLAKFIKKTKRLYGCDICQEVCPHNGARQKATIQTAPIAGDSLSTKILLAKKSILSSDDAFLKTFAGSPVMRAKRKGMTRNAKILSKNANTV